MDNVQLPVDLYEPTVVTAEPGQVFWVTPWSIHADPDANLWLVAGAPRHEQASGTACVRVTRLASGVAVDRDTLYGSNHRWAPGDTVPGGHGIDTSDLVPVVEWIETVG